MKYVVYFAVATPLLLGWLFYEAATLPPRPPLFVDGLEGLSTQPIAADSGTKAVHNTIAKIDSPATE